MICNSQGESSRSGFKALKRVWPELGKRLKAERGGEWDDDDAPAWYGGKVFGFGRLGGGDGGVDDQVVRVVSVRGGV